MLLKKLAEQYYINAIALLSQEENKNGDKKKINKIKNQL